MTIHTIRPGFTITLGNITYVGGEEVDLTDEEFELNKHKLEGVESTVIPIDFGNGDSNSDCCYPAPYISFISPPKILIGRTSTIAVNGSFFTPETTVEIEAGSVDSIEFLSSNLIQVTITANAKAGKPSVTRLIQRI